MARCESIVFVEPAGVGMIRELGSVVPLPERSGRITGCLEGIGNGPFVEIQPLSAGGDTADSASGVVPASEKLRSRWGAHRAHVEVFEQSTFAPDGVDVWRREISVAVEAEVAPALIVGQNDQDIGPRVLGRGSIGPATESQRRGGAAACEQLTAG